MTKRGARASGTGVPREVSCIWASSVEVDVQPTLERARPTCRALFSSGRFVRERARVGPRHWPRIRKQFLARNFVSAIWPSCRGARTLAVRESAVVRSTTPCSTSLNAWPARPRPSLATPQGASKLAPCTALAARRAASACAYLHPNPLAPCRWHTLRDRKWLDSRDRPHAASHCADNSVGQS